MGASITRLHALQPDKFREYQFQQTTAVQLNESLRRNRWQDDFVQFVCNAFFGDDGDAFAITLQRIECLIVNIESQLGGKTDTAHHAQRVITESYIRVEGSPDGLFLQVSNTAKGVDQLAITHPVQANSQCIDGKITAVLVILQCTVLYNRLAGIVCIRFFSCTHKLNFRTIVLQLCRTEILEDGNMRPTPQTLTQRLGHGNATAYHHHINILGRTLQENITYISTDYVTFQSQFISRFGYPLEYIITKILLQFFCRQIYHK